MAPDPIGPPQVFLSYSHDSPAHMDRVLALCDRLRLDGVDATLDQYEVAPPEGWPRWAVRQIEAAGYVLIICTENYRHRFDGTAARASGLGVKWEGAVLNQVLYDSESETGKLVPVVLTPEDVKYIPTVLRGMTRYDLSNSEGYELLYRHLTNQPAVRRPDLGPLVPLAPKPRASVFSIASAQPHHYFPRGIQHAPLGHRNGVLLLVAFLILAATISALAYRSFENPQPAQPSALRPALQLLRGQILDDQTSIPLAGVLVTLPELNLQQTTNHQGLYRFEVAVSAGRRLKLRAFREGYLPINVDPPAGTDFLNTHHMRRAR
jgi:hypothetical protein